MNLEVLSRSKNKNKNHLQTIVYYLSYAKETIKANQSKTTHFLICFCNTFSYDIQSVVIDKVMVIKCNIIL